MCIRSGDLPDGSSPSKLHRSACRAEGALWLVAADAVVEDLLQLLTTARGPNAKCRHVRLRRFRSISGRNANSRGSAAILLSQ
jgi:hypothetical protein